MTEEEFFTFVVFAHGLPARRAFADRDPNSSWGIRTRSQGVSVGAHAYRKQFVTEYCSRMKVPQHGSSAVFNRFIRWLAAQGHVDIHVNKKYPNAE